jgi:DNA-binding CsgD family transcriptional regulator
MKAKKKTQSQTGEPWSEVSVKLTTLIRLSALNVVKDLKTQKEQIATLSDAGFGPTEIADILKTTRNTVNVALSAIRKEKASAKAEEKKDSQAEAPTVTPAADIQPEVKESAQES